MSTSSNMGFFDKIVRYIENKFKIHFSRSSLLEEMAANFEMLCESKG
jgi:hypothetical protein